MTTVVLRFVVSRVDLEAAITRGGPMPSLRSSLLWATGILGVGFLIRSNAAPLWMVWTCFALGSSLVVLAVCVPLCVAWLWRRNRRTSENCELRADESGLLVIEPEAEAREAWSSFLRWEETRDLFLLFRARAESVLIPKRAFETEADLEVFRGLLERRVPSVEAPNPIESPSP